jgi:hypothetical protein
MIGLTLSFPEKIYSLYWVLSTFYLGRQQRREALMCTFSVKLERGLLLFVYHSRRNTMFLRNSDGLSAFLSEQCRIIEFMSALENLRDSHVRSIPSHAEGAPLERSDILDPENKRECHSG